MLSFDAACRYAAQSLGVEPADLARAFGPATAREIPAILALRRRVVCDMWWEDEPFLRWRYFGRRRKDDTSSYWVLRKGGAVIGGCGLEPVTLVIDGQPCEAVRTMDIMVFPELDGLGLGAFMNIVLFEKFPVVLVTGSNDKSHNLLSRLFQHTLDLTTWKTLIESRSTLEDKVNAWPLSGVLASGTDLLLTLARWGRRLQPPAGYAIAEIAPFDDRVSDLSRRCERLSRVMVRRDSESLNWRFFENPRCRYRALGAFAGDRLDAYVVTRINRNRPNPRHEGDIVDWLSAPAEDAGAPLLPALLQAAVDDLASEGACLVTCAAADPAIEPALNANGFHERPGQRLPFFVRAASPRIHERLAVGGGWLLTRGDYDVE